MRCPHAILLALALGLFATPRAASAARARPLRTGQETSYGAPRDTAAGLARIYEDGGSWIHDRRTGLTWEKKDDSGGIHDKDARYTWSADGGTAADGTAFTTFLAALNRPPCFAGFCDWRMPTRFELESILDLGRVAPAVAPAFQSGCAPGCATATCSCTASGFYWSATTFDFLPDSAWDVGFEVGAANVFGKAGRDHVRAVRP